MYSTLLASCILNFLFTLSKTNPIRIHFNGKKLKYFKIGSFTVGSSILDFFSNEIDILIIGKLLGAESLGLYSLAKQLVVKLYAVINPIITSVLSPVLSYMQEDKTQVKKYYMRIINILSTINIPVYLNYSFVKRY